MKKLLPLLTLVAVFLVVQGCGKKKGFPELPEFELPEPKIENLVFEVTGDIKITNGYGEIFAKLDQPLEAGDVMLGYIFWDVDLRTGEDIWRLLPEAYYLDEGILTYKFENTRIDYNFIIETTFNADNLESFWYEDLRFRAVLIKGKLMSQSGRINFSDYNAVMEWLEANEEDVIQVQATR